MKDFAIVLNNSKKAVLEQKQALYESQKIAIVKVLKENYMVTCPISELPEDQQKVFATRLLEYWSPKTGINKAGQRLLNENELTLSTRSTKEDIKLYIEKKTRQHLVAITEAYRNNNSSTVLDVFRKDIEPMIQKTLKESFLSNTIWNIVGDRIKNSL